MTLTRKDRLVLLSPLAVFGVFALVPMVEDGPTICPFALTTGMACPGCGMTRAAAQLLRGDLGAAMTLPGIAGFILTMGMGVDSNVLIFERIKEELAAQRGARTAVNASFSRVFLTLLDTHITALIAAAFLFQFGTGPIRGFATTLTIGLLTNLFTSIFVSKTLFEMVLQRQTAKQSLSI